MTEHRPITLLLLLFLGVGSLYALTTPIFEASDELWHYPLVRHLADGNPLPVQDPENVGPWKQEASQPPLYYYLSAALTFWIDTSDMESVRWLNPHVDNGVITSDGNINLAIHNPAWNRWQGTLLAVTVIRLFSIILSSGTVYLTYRLAKAVMPGRPDIALGAAGINAFMPMFLFISGAVNNDNLAISLTSLGLILMIHIIQQCATWKQWLLLGMVLGLGALTKQGALTLFPLAWGTAFIFAWQKGGRQLEMPALFHALIKACLIFALTMLPVLLIAGWWYGRNIQLYGDLLGWNAFFEVLGIRAHPASLAQLWDERWGFMLSYWGLFGGVNVPMSYWIYRVLNILVVLGVLGFVGFVFRLLFTPYPSHSPVLRLQGEGTVGMRMQVLTFIEAQFPLVLSLLLSLAVVVGLIRWATNTWSSQGRLVFTAISALSTLLALGLAGWMPAKIGRWLMGIIVTFLFSISVAAPFVWIMPAYQPPSPPVTINQTLDNVTFGQQMQLLDVTVTQEEILPGESIAVSLSWQVLQETAADYSVFIHLVDPVVGVPIAQRDMYPGRGLMPTTLLRSGDLLRDNYEVKMPATAIAPGELQLQIGLYDFKTEERLTLQGGSTAFPVTTIKLLAREGDIPNPVSVNFGDELQLLGYQVNPRLAPVGSNIELTLFWQANRPLTEDYTFFAQVLGENNHRWAADDKPPNAGTASWQPNTVQSVTMTLPLAVDTPLDVYPIFIGAYTRSDAGIFQRLQIVTPDGRLTQDDMMKLTLIRVENRGD